MLVHRQQHAMHVRLQKPRQAVARHTARSQRRIHQGNAEVMSHSQLVFNF